MKIFSKLLLVLIFISCNGKTTNKEEVKDELYKLYQGKEFPDCVSYTKKKIREFDNDGDFVLFLKKIQVECLLAQNKYEETIDLSNEIVEYAPYPLNFIHRGMCYELNNKYGRALQDYTYVIDKFKNIEGYIKRSSLYIKLEKYELANIDCDSALVLDSNSFHALNNKGVILVELREYEKAIPYYKRALAIKESTILYNNIARAYNILTNEDSACLYWKKSSDLGNKDAENMLKQKCIIN